MSEVYPSEVYPIMSAVAVTRGSHQGTLGSSRYSRMQTALREFQDYPCNPVIKAIHREMSAFSLVSFYMKIFCSTLNVEFILFHPHT